MARHSIGPNSVRFDSTTTPITSQPTTTTTSTTSNTTNKTSAIGSNLTNAAQSIPTYVTNTSPIVSVVRTPDGYIYNTNSNGITDEYYQMLKSSGMDVSHMTHITGKNHKIIWKGPAFKEDTFLQKWGNTINTTIAAGQLGLSVASYLQNKKLFASKRALMDEQKLASEENRAHLKKEWARVDSIRKNINSSYSSNKANTMKVKLSDS